MIERCLSTLLKDARPGELEIVVVCNGCSDDTAQRARAFASEFVKVIETDVASKTNALNLGDQQVSTFPRFYVDADIELTISAVRDVAGMLRDDSPVVVAAPRAVVSYRDRPWPVRAFYHVWTSLPYFRENMVGSGVYAFSRKGRALFGEFPTLTADDEFARLQVGPQQRRASDNSRFIIHPPRTIQGLVDIMTRARSGMYEFEQRFPALTANNQTSSGRSLRIIASTPSLWPYAPVYLGVMAVAALRARRRLRKGTDAAWERDNSSRE